MSPLWTRRWRRRGRPCAGRGGAPASRSGPRDCAGSPTNWNGASTTWSPSSATILAEVMAAAGVPDGVFNLVHGFGPGSAGELLTRHPGVDAITFTGESATGSAIMRAAADGVKAVSFELGGKNAGLVFADSDLDAALAGSVRSSFANGGQVCLCTERLYVARPVFDEFVTRLGAAASSLTM